VSCARVTRSYPTDRAVPDGGWDKDSEEAGRGPPLPRSIVPAAQLREADGGTVAAVRDGKRAGGGAGVAVRAPAGRPRRYRSQEGPAGLPLGIRDHGGEG